MTHSADQVHLLRPQGLVRSENEFRRYLWLLEANFCNPQVILQPRRTNDGLVALAISANIPVVVSEEEYRRYYGRHDSWHDTPGPTEGTWIVSVNRTVASIQMGEKRITKLLKQIVDQIPATPAPAHTNLHTPKEREARVINLRDA